MISLQFFFFAGLHSGREPPRSFLSSFFCKCILQGAIDFAEVRSEAELEAWPALHISLSFSCGYIAPHHAAFSTCILQGAIDFAERSSGVRSAELEAWLALHLTLNNLRKSRNIALDFNGLLQGEGVFQNPL